MKNIFKIITPVALALVLLVSCDQEDYTGYSNVHYTKSDVVSASISASGSNVATSVITGNDVTINEATVDPAFEGKTATFNIEATISKPSSITTYIDLTQTDGTMSSSDYSVQRIRIPQGETTGYGSITFFMTGDLEGDETLQLTVNAGSPNVQGSQVFNFTMTDDYINDNMILEFAWCKDYEHEVDDDTHTGNYGDVIDLDFYVLDDSFNDTGNYSGATGSCPEEVSFRGMADGTYYVAGVLFANNVSNYGFGETIPIDCSYSQEYFVDQSVTVYNSVVLTSDSPAPALLGWMAKVEKTGYNYVVSEISSCDWTLDKHDAWGDGWNGGFIRVSVDFGGAVTSTDYTLANGSEGTDIISVIDGADVTFEYFSGSYNGEVSFELTAPDGTVYAGGPGPADGVIYSGTNTCN